MNNLSKYIIEKLYLNKNLKSEPTFVLLEARNNYLYEEWDKKYQYIVVNGAKKDQLFIITEKEAEDIIENTSRTCYWMYEWPTIFKTIEELQDAFTHGEMSIKVLNNYPEFIKSGKI